MLGALGAACAVARAAHAQSSCPLADLPAYAHNDYENERPLDDALAAGYRGVEVDVFLIDGVVRVGHDRGRARRAGTLEELYLAPLAERIARCGRLTPDRDRPFLLLIEIKERSPDTFDAVARLLARHAGMFGANVPGGGREVEVVMVGWHPRADAGERAAPLAYQWRIAGHADTLVAPTERSVRLLSLDYGKTMGRPWRTAAGRRRWLRTLAAVRRGAAGRLVRVHNVPADSAIYARLLAAGADLIGTRELGATRRILTSIARR